MKQRLTFLVIWTFIVTTLLVWPGLVHAQGPLSYNFSSSTDTDDFTGQKCWDSSGAIKTGSGNGATTPECYTNSSGDWLPITILRITSDTIKSRLGLDSTTFISVSARFQTFNNAYRLSRVQVMSGETTIASSEFNSQGDYDQTLSTSVSGTFDSIEFYQYYNNYTNPSAYGFIDDIVISASGTPSVRICSTVQNADFADAEIPIWLLSGTAAISDSTLTLSPGDIAAQNLTLTASKTYNAVISATAVSASTPLKVALGTASETLTITAPGWYTATFTTPANLVGPIIYGLENDDGGMLDIDYTCVSLALGSGGESGCLAPTNGTFESDAGWNWYRGAEWFYPGKYASLPVAGNGLIGSTGTYTMPALAEEEHLLLGFTARGMGNGGVISGQVGNETSDVEFNLSTYPAEYTYEIGLSSLAEEDNIQFSFANPGTVITDVVSTVDVTVDNICVFTANRGPNLPTPTDPDGITPIDPGLQGFTSCASLDSIWAGFGVNMAQYRASYAAGTSVWDPLGWVPWLIAAIFVTLGDWACFFFAAFLNLIDLLTYFLNSVMNIGNWFVRMWPAFVAWVSLWNDWLAGSLTNISNAIGNALAAWSEWQGDALWATVTTVSLTIAAMADWLAASLTNISNAIGNTLAAWSEWLGGLLAYWSALIAATLAAAAEWIGASLTNLSNAIGNALTAWSEWIGGLLAYWSALIAATLAAVAEWIGASLANLSDSIATFLNSWSNWIAESLAALAAWIGFSAWLDWVIAAWDFLVAWFWGAVDEVWAWLGVQWGYVVAVYEFLLALLEMLWMLVLYVWANIQMVGAVPIRFYYAFDNSLNSAAYTSFVDCGSGGFWCVFLAGVQIINQSMAHTIFYPITIIGIILSTVTILWRDFKKLYSV